MTTTTPTAWKIGDKVTPHPDYFPALRGQEFTITKAPTRANEVNYLAHPDGDTTRRGIRAKAEMLLPPGTAPEPAPYTPCPPVGAVVSVAGVAKITDGALFVVLGPAKNRLNCVKLAALGGDGDRYWTAIPLDRVTVIRLADLRAHLA